MDDDFVDGCELDFTEGAVDDEQADFEALFPVGQTAEERNELIESLKFLEALDA